MQQYRKFSIDTLAKNPVHHKTRIFYRNIAQGCSKISFIESATTYVLRVILACCFLYQF